MDGKMLRCYRDERGISLTELAEMTGVSKAYLSMLERGIQQNPSIAVVEKIASALNIHANDLLDQDEWIALAVEAKDSGVDIDQFKIVLEFLKWYENRNK